MWVELISLGWVDLFGITSMFYVNSLGKHGVGHYFTITIRFHLLNKFDLDDAVINSIFLSENKIELHIEQYDIRILKNFRQQKM